MRKPYSLVSDGAIVFEGDWLYEMALISADICIGCGR
jgi:hypothetical protein